MDVLVTEVSFARRDCKGVDKAWLIVMRWRRWGLVGRWPHLQASRPQLTRC